MSDIFSFKDDYENPKQQFNHAQSESEYWAKKNERRAQLNAEYQEDLDRYSVNISQEDYNIIKDAIANADVPEDEAYRWACAMELNKQYDMPVAYAYQNLEQINAAKWGDRFTFTPKTNFKAIVDSGRLGANTLKMGRLGSKIMKAQMFGKTEYNNYLAGKVESLDDMMAQYEALEQESASLTDLEDRNFAIEALKFAAQSAPYTGYVAGVGLLGGLLSGGVGTAAAFAVSMDNAAGLEYMRLRKAGSDVGDAAGFAILSGGLQALVETSLGNVAGALGKKSLGDLASQAVKNKITGNVFKRLAYNGTFKDLALRMGKEWLKENAEEGLEEVVQDLIEKGTDALAAELGGYEIEGLDAKTIARDAWENFKGGVMGSLILGLPTSAIKGKADIKEFVNVRKLAEVTPSLETFNKFTEDSTLWEGMSEEEKKNAQKTTWENAQARVEAAAETEARKIAEGRDAAEGAEEAPAENEDGSTEANPVARDEAGRLYTSDDVSTDDAGNVTGGTFVVGDKTKSENNRYGYIKYSQDAEGNITIDTFKMTEGRDKLRAEAFDEFARQHPDVNIEWNATAPDLQDFKNELIDANPSGKKNGLNYYSTTDLDNIQARKKVAEELRKNIHNIEDLGNNNYRKTELTNKQIAAGVTLIESAARRMNMGLAEYVNKTFGSQIFGSYEDFSSASLAQGENVNKKAGGMKQGLAQANWKEVGQQIKAVIYAGEKADFSTWAHEMAHVFQNQLEGQLKTDAEAAFNVQNGDWINSTYTFKDGRTLSSAEAFAYGFQDWLETGKAENEQMRNIFQKFAEFIADCYNRLKKHLDFTPEIESVFNQLLDGDDTIMSKALKATQEQDNEYRASLKRQAEEKQAAMETEKEQAKKQAEAAREEASEGTEFPEEESTEEKLAAAENRISEVNNETEKTANAIDDALENTNLTDEQKDEISEVLNDASTTVVEKAEATTEAAESAYDEDAPYDLFQNEGALLSQLIGEPSIRRMAENEERTRILLDLKLAQDMKADGKDAGTIRRATGWEEINNEWKYETDDSVIDILDKANINKNLNANPNQLITDYGSTRRNLDKVLDAPELFNIYPILKNVRVSFYKAEDAQRSRLSEDGILLNTRYLDKVVGPESIKTSLMHEVQKLIHALEHNKTKSAVGENIDEYIAAADALDREMRQAILNINAGLNYDKAAIQDKIKNIMSKRGDEEARIVASRVLLNADQRKWKTLAQSKSEVQGKLLSQEENPDFIEAVNKAQDLLFQDKLTMYGIHNLSEEALRHAVKMGGLANPSMAVVDTEKNSFTNFGEVSLIPYNYMLEKGEGSKGTFGADIYSPRYPSLTINVTPEGRDTITSMVSAVKDIDEEFSRILEDKIANGIEYHGEDKRFLYEYFRIPFLADKGYKDFYYRNESKFGADIIDEYRKIYDKKENAKTMRELYEQFIEKEYDKELVAELKEDLKDKDKEYNLLSAFENQLWQSNRTAGKIDYGRTERNANEIIDKDPELKKEFEKYVNEKLESIDKKERIFNGFTPSGNRRYLEHTLENVSKYMRQQELQGGESFYYGLGSTRAKFTPNFKTLNQIKKARDRLVTSEEFEKIKEEYEARFEKIIDELRGEFDYDVGAARFEEAFQYGKSDPIGYLRDEYNLSIDELAQEILDFATALRVMPTEYFETKYTRPVTLNEFAGAIIPSNLAEDLKEELKKDVYYIEEYDPQENNREEVTKAALNKWNETRRILFQDEDIQQQVNQLMTMEKAKDMIQRTFVLANIKDWYDGEYANGDEWLKDRGVDEVAMYVDNEWQIQEKFLNNIPALMDGDFTSADIIEAYLNGTLTGPQQKKEALKPIDRSVDTGFTDDRFYAPRRIDTDAKELLEKASVKVTDANRKEVYKARADFITAAHEPGFAASIGMSQAAVNKKIMSWAAYPANASKISNNINKDVSLQNKWTGIVNSNLLKLFSIDKEQLMSMVKDVTGNPSEYQLAYVTSVILALDTHIDFSGLTYEFNAHIEKDTTAAQYSPYERKIQIKRDSLNTIAHETGHALDHLWGREILGGDAYLTESVRIKANSDTITDPNVKSFLQHFADFLESIENVSDLRSGYTMDSKEVFARFVARFTEWTRNVATNNRFGFERDWYNDKFTTQQYYEFAKILQEKSALDTTKQKLLSQEVYHGSGADFDKFDTEQYGLSGEGSMSFGYGTYLTDNEDIAREYARRQGKTVIILDGEVWQPEKNNFYETLIYSNLTAGKTLEDIKEWAESIKYPDRKSLLLDKIKELEDKGLKVEGYNRHLYTVEIPDDGYLEWNEHISKDDVKNIVSKFVDFMLAQPSKNETKIHEVEDVDSWYWDDITGHGLYETLEVASSNRPQLVSQFLHSIGYAGIKYPAGTIHGNGNGAYNYVIFNDDDAKIVDKLLFQTNAELMDEAKSFDSWQEFMEYCELFHADDEVSPIPGDADAQWYQTFWETSRGVQTEQEKNEEAVQAKSKKEGMLPSAVDALFTTMIRSDPQMVDSFLQAVAEIDAIDLDSEEWQQAENAEDAAQRDKIEQLKDFINITLSDYNWQTALRRIQGGHEISEGLRKRLIGEMTDSFKARDFRALYSEVMKDPQFAVAEEDSITASLNKKLKKYHDIVKPTDDITRWSPERRKQLAEQLANREIAAKIKSGSLKLDDELDAYIKSLNKQIKETQDQYNELEKETKADYQRIADKERRDLLKLHEQLLLARGKLKSRNTEVNRKIAKGLKITDKYSRLTQNLNANYDELFRKYNDLKNTITINAEVQAALDRQEQVAGLREDLNAKQKEKNLTAEVKKMRIQLVKKTMRRVPFNRIDYNNARTVIAIQRMLEPNLLGGVNRFIGIDSPYLRGVISQIVTDSDYKEKIMNYLSKNTKASQAFADFKKKLTELKSIKDFDSWTAKERKAAIRYLPKENWVRDLNLKELAKEREESIDLDIGMEEVKRTVYDEKTGEPKTYKDNEGNTHNVTETAFRLKYDEELGRLVQDAVGADMFDKIVNMPFSEWTTEDLETLAQRIDELYTEGRDLKAAKDEARKKEAAAIRKRIEDAIKETGITINDDDTPEEKERKQKQIDKILGMSDDLKGTEAGKPKGLKARLNRLLHSYSDMNVLRFARMLDGQSEGENVRMLYRKEDDCYNAKQRSMNGRAEKIYKVMKDNNITEGDLAEVVKVPTLGTEFTVDELLYFLAADKDYAEDEKKLQRGLFGIDANDDYAATSRNAVMFGNMMSDMMSQEEKESWLQLDKDMEEALQNDTLTQEQKEQLATGQLDKKPGTTRYIMACHAKWEVVLGAANNYLSTHPEYKALMEAIEEDYASQYERMNEISINEFNMPVHRVKAYVPLVRRESNGDTNENQVKEDLLGVAGVGKQWADRGMTQRRVNISPLNQKPVQTGLFRTWGDSIERTEHFIAYAPYVRQLNAIYKSRDASYTRRYIESRYGNGAIKYLDEYINEVANPNAGRIRERGAEWLHVLRGKTAPAYLGWKASAIIKQGLTSPWPYMQFVNPAEYVAAAMKFTFNPQMREAIKEKSVFMKMRRMDPVNDLIDEMADSAKTKLDRGWSNFSKLGMQGLELIDWACVAPGWLACYEKKYNQLQNASNARYEAKMAELKERNMYADVGTSEYLTPQQMEAEAKKEMLEDIEAEAVRYADDCTRACQPSNRVTDLAPLFKNSSEAMKAFLQFQTSLNVIWQNLRYDMPYAVKNKEFTRIAGTVIGYVCAGIFMNSVMEGIGGDDDDDETQALRNLIYYSTTQFTDSIPIMGSEITNTMDQLITGKRGFYGSGTDMTPSATKLLSVLTTAKKGNWEKAAELTAEGIGLYLGAPVSGAKEINKLLGKPLKEGDVNLKRGISDVYGIAGDIIDE